ncbi:hypothetical protein [Nocardioides sp. SR21]|uniref:hypothetical protein n=1 Tax=Nocardioides sp. SR21 TaxID=2919501 RepID=UPI001FAB0D1C|nr:hypothetical protein [Nocardioides sp. SR21]
MSSVLRAAPAYADDTYEVDLSGMPPLVINYGPGDSSTPINVELPGTGAGQQQAASQCTAIPGIPGNTLCLGGPTDGPQTPIEVTGASDSAPVVKAGEEAASALGWMVAEAVEYIRVTYDLPSDERILRYARPQVRAYMLNRLLDIMDRKVYGVELTEDEQRALDFVENEYGLDDRVQAQAAYDEYKAFEGVGGCGYRPPLPPAGTPLKALPLPKAVKDACDNAQSSLAAQFAFAPPIPSVDDFTTWGAYAKGHDLGLDAYAKDAVRKNAADAAVAATVGAGIGLAIGAAAAVGALVGASASLSALVVFVIGSQALFASSVGSAGAVVTTLGSATTVGAGAAAGPVGIILVAAVILAISIWQVVQRESVGAELKKRVDEAKGTDPLGLNPLIAKYSGQPIRSGYTPGNEPEYRSAEATNKLLGNIVRWTTVNQLDQAVPDSTRLWTDNETTSADRRFLVRVGTGPVQEKSSISVPQKGGYASVRFSRDWMIVQQAGQEETAALGFGYQDVDGTDKVAARAPSSLGGWSVTGSDNKGLVGTNEDTISYLNAAGQRVRVQLKPEPYANLSGPRPSAVGPLIANRPVILRPNPVNEDGSTIDYEASQADFTYDWAVQRLDPDTQQWIDVPTPGGGYGTSFTPTVTGRYRADVTMTQKSDTSVKKYGVVEFPVSAPAIATPTLTLIDNGSNRAEVDLQMTEPVPGDEITTTVTWPSELGATGPAPTTTITQTCVQTDPLECTTPRTGLVDSLVHTLTPATDLRQPITVTSTNQYGGSFTQELRLDNPGRPSFEAPPDDANDTMPGTVTVTDRTAQLEFPLVDQANSDYQVATLVPGTGGGQEFGLVDPATGNTTGAFVLPDSGNLVVSTDGNGLFVSGHPTVDNLGTYDVPIVVSQTNTNRNLMVVSIHVVPSTENRFRAAVLSDVDPLDFAVDHLPTMYPAVLGGRTEWGWYDGNVCVGLTYQGGGPPDPERRMCGPIPFFYDADGVESFPYAKLFPLGLEDGTYRARAWLPDAGPRADTSPLTTTFILTQEVDVPTPPVTSAPSVSGAAKVGTTLRATVPTYPASASTTYQWLRDGKPIAGATKATYTPGAADRGHRLGVRARSSAADYQATTETSTRTAEVALGSLTKTPTPKLSGRADVGRTLTAKPGAWDAGVTLKYRWFADDRAIKGATGKTLQLTRALKGARITLQVTGSKPGYAAETRTSKPSAVV